jgi:hypothetical protein
VLKMRLRSSKGPTSSGLRRCVNEAVADTRSPGGV